MAAKPSAQKKLKQPDEFITLSSRLLTFATTYYRHGLALLLLLAVAVGGWGLYQQHRASQLAAASDQLAQLRLELSLPGPSADTLAALEKLAATYPGLGPSVVARIYQAHLLYQDKKYADAAALYRSLQGRDPGLDVLLTENLSYCLEAQGQYEAAAAALNPLVQEAQPAFRTDYLRRQAFLYERAGNRPQAAALYKELLTLRPNPILASFLQEKIASLEAAP